MYQPQYIALSELELSHSSTPHFVPGHEDYAEAGLQQVTYFPSENANMVYSSYPDPETLAQGPQHPYFHLPALTIPPQSPQAGDYPESLALSPTLTRPSTPSPITPPTTSPHRPLRTIKRSRLCTCGCASYLRAEFLRQHAVTRWESMGLISGPIAALFRAPKKVSGRRGMHECLCGCGERFTRLRMVSHLVAQLNEQGKLLPLEWEVFEEKRVIAKKNLGRMNRNYERFGQVAKSGPHRKRTALY
ncbi:hypothetical protein HYFRA_00010631 [Hymenoscyphus fraxineus]|uniref:Uncharacterized protein n=1 Tax=Hymenoscyphus fraxineus TaxID=746836 RepID=A0A9N9L9T1_9HELO|nr:hypothetical protein HYFRA_00010631 [Hymenoscyphus fraxineus]